MFSLLDLFVVAVIALITGGALGFLSNRFFSSGQKKNRSLEIRLRQAESQLTEYQQQVTHHFAETARLVNTLTRNYRDVHEHLASDALKLANVDISRQLLTQTDSGTKPPQEAIINQENFQPPRDWAPKTPGKTDTPGECFDIGDDFDCEEASGSNGDSRSRLQQPAPEHS